MQKPVIKSNIHPLELKTHAFTRGIFDFITIREGLKNHKQEKALEILTNNITREFLYGGAAGGGKSWLGASWLLFQCLAYPKTKWFIGREELKRLRMSTLITCQGRE